MLSTEYMIRELLKKSGYIHFWRIEDNWYMHWSRFYSGTAGSLNATLLLASKLSPGAALPDDPIDGLAGQLINALGGDYASFDVILPKSVPLTSRTLYVIEWRCSGDPRSLPHRHLETDRAPCLLRAAGLSVESALQKAIDGTLAGIVRGIAFPEWWEDNAEVAWQNTW